MGNIPLKLFQNGSVIQEKILLRDFYIFLLWRSFCSTERNHLCNFGSSHYG